MAEVGTYTALAAAAIDRTADFIYVRDATGPTPKKASPQALFDANLQGSHATLGDLTLGSGAHGITLHATIATLQAPEIRIKHAGLSAASENLPLVNIDGPEGTGEYRPLSESAIEAQVVDSSATSYTLTDANRGQTLRFTSGSAVAVSVPSSLATGFWCRLLQFGSGKVTPSGSGGATVRGPQNHVATGHQYATMTLTKVAANEFIASGHVGA